MKSLFPFILIILCESAQAQHAGVIPLENPSMEGPTGMNVIPPGWDIVQGTPATGPVSNTEYASDQQTFVRLFQLGTMQETAVIGQQLLYPLAAGITYTLSFDMGANGGPGTMILAGSSQQNTPGEILWKSTVFEDRTWKHYTIIFTPTQTINYIQLYPYVTPEKTAGGIMLDNFSPIRETLNLKLSATRTCIGKTTGTVAVGLPGPATDYSVSWQPGAYTTTVVDNLAAGLYEVNVVRLTDGITGTQSIDVGVSAPSVSARIKQVSCYNKTDALIQLLGTRGIFPYQYYVNDENNTSGLFNNIGPGNYTIKVVDSIGCSAEKDTLLTEPSRFFLDKMTVRNIPCTDASNGQIILTPFGGTYPYTYSIPGYDPQQDSIFSQLVPGTYPYRITDSANCTIDSSASITKTLGDCAVYVPNAFSPNGDGVNDLFHVKIMDDVYDYRLAVYSRWGQLVYETRVPEAGWDGSFKGVKLAPGSYIWSVTYTDNKNQAMKQQGSVVLIN